jgi:hypothetical protein
MASLGRKREYVHSPAFHADAAQSASTTHFTPGGLRPTTTVPKVLRKLS